ncbi:MAG: terminase large subunit domain-containing protein, partial [Phyllobacterium sp.]
VRVVTGSVDDDGTRHIPEIFALVGKKNSKTTYSGGMILTLLLANKTPRAEILFVGPTQEIADTAFQAAVGMIEDDDEGYLQKRFHIIEHKKTIRDRVTKAFIKIKTFDMKVMTGSKPVIVLIDELHIMGSIHFASRVIRQIRGALVRRKDSLLIIISTQSDERPAGAFKTELEYARAVRDGKIRGNIRMLPILYEFPESWQVDESKPWADPRNWHLVMPNLGKSLDLDSMIADHEAEQHKGSENEIIWASQHLNIQVGMALHGDRWGGADYWLGAADTKVTLDFILKHCDVCTAGADGGSLDDLFGLAIFGRERITRRWYGWFHAWAHPVVLKRRKEIAPKLLDFQKEKSLTITADATQHLRDIAGIIKKVGDAGLLPEKNSIGIDPNNIAELVDELARAGIDTDKAIFRLRQGTWLASAVWGLERKLENGTFTHDGSGLMAYCVSNAKIERKGNADMITKAAAGTAKIDPLIAGLHAAIMMSWNPEASPRNNIDDFLSNPIMVGV